jgi:hypothetical protein
MVFHALIVLHDQAISLKLPQAEFAWLKLAALRAYVGCDLARAAWRQVRAAYSALQFFDPALLDDQGSIEWHRCGRRPAS